MNPVHLTGFWAGLYIAIIWGSLIGTLIFPVWYGFTRPWYSSPMGQYLMVLSSTVAVIMVLVSIRPLFSSGPVMASPIGVAIIAILGACGWWIAWLFYRTGRRDRE